jgi:hypothetical protein
VAMPITLRMTCRIVYAVSVSPKTILLGPSKPGYGPNGTPTARGCKEARLHSCR